MLITNGGVLIRTRASEISELSRATQGVTLISLDSGEKLIGLSRVPEADDDGELGAAEEGVDAVGNGAANGSLPDDDEDAPEAGGDAGDDA